MKIIWANGKQVLINDEDYDLGSYYWGLNSKGYVCRDHRINGSHIKIYLARIVADRIGLLKYLHIDHVDRNPLNNQRSNLRSATIAQNCRNRGPNKNSKSGIKGVFWREDRKKWEAQIRVDGKLISLGRYYFKESAIKAYNEAALKYFREFSYLNSEEVSYC